MSNQVDNFRQQHNKLQQRIQNERATLLTLQDSQEDKQRDLAVKMQLRNRNLDTIVYHQDLYKHLVEARTKAKGAGKPLEELERRLQEETNTLQKLNNIAGYLAQKGDPVLMQDVEPIHRHVNARLDMMSDNQASLLK